MTIQNTINTLFPGNQGITLNKEAGTDAGVDVSFPAGHIVSATTPGLFRKDLSTGFQQVFQIGSDLFESFTHVVPLPGGEPAYVNKGAPIGIVSGLIGNYSSGGINYDSTGPHAEIGFANNPTGPASFFAANTLDPYPILESQAKGTFQPGPIPTPSPISTGSNPGIVPGTSGQPATPPDPNTSWIIADFGALGNISIPKAPFIRAGVIAGVLLFVVVIFAVLLISITHNTETTVKTESVR